MLAEPIAGQEVSNGSTVLHGNDRGLIVTFYTRPVHLDAESKSAGRPIFKDRVFCKILTPGDSLSIWDQPARESDKQRFPMQWKAFENGMVIADDGTPLEAWTRMTPSKIASYKASGIRTVEQVSTIADSNGHAMPMDWQSDRVAAQAYLKAAEDSAFAQKMAEDNAAKDAEIARLRANLADLGSKVDQLMSDRPEGKKK